MWLRFEITYLLNHCQKVSGGGNSVFSASKITIRTVLIIGFQTYSKPSKPPVGRSSSFHGHPAISAAHLVRFPATPAQDNCQWLSKKMLPLSNKHIGGSHQMGENQHLDLGEKNLDLKLG